MPAGAGIFCRITVRLPDDYLTSMERDSPLASLRLGRRMKSLVKTAPGALQVVAPAPVATVGNQTAQRSEVS